MGKSMVYNVWFISNKNTNKGQYFSGLNKKEAMNKAFKKLRIKAEDMLVVKHPNLKTRIYTKSKVNK